MSDHGEPRFDIQMRCMCAPFPQHDHKHVQVVLKFQSPYFNWATDPILQFFPQKHTYKGIIRRYLGTLLLFTHTHRNFNPLAQSHHHTNSTSVCLSENLSYEFIIISVFSSSIFDYEFDYHFFWTKATLHLAFIPFPDEAAALSLSSLSPSSTSDHIISAVSPLSHTLLLMCSDACQVSCSSGKPTPVTLHPHCFQTYMYMYHSTHAHPKIPNLFPITY